MIYDKFARDYDQSLAPFEKRFLSRWRAETLAFLPEDSRILEIGAGTGLNFRFYPPSKCAVASEISLKMLELAREKTERIELVQADAETLPFAANFFDAAFATLVFCSIPHPERAFAELQRVVKNGGRIVLLEQVRPKGILGYGFDFLNIFTTALIEDCFNRETARLAAESGLKVLEVREKAFGAVNLIVCEVEKAEGARVSKGAFDLEFRNVDFGLKFLQTTNPKSKSTIRNRYMPFFARAFRLFELWHRR